MRILEVRDDFLKFEVSGDISLSSFIKVTDGDNAYVGQVVKIKRCGGYSVAYAKLLYVYDGKFQPYSIVSISHSAVVTEFSFDMTKQLFEQEKPVIVSRFIDADKVVSVDYSSLAGKSLICIDNSDSAEIIINNLKSNMSAYSNVLVLDTTGIIKNAQYNAGKDFKLSLNLDGLNFLYENCLCDVTPESKVIIKGVFSELSEYAKQVPFLPFSALKTIIDEMVNKKHEFKLWVLKNKLDKLAQLGYFASNADEADSINQILQSKIAMIDFSRLDAVFLNRYLEVLYSAMSHLDNPPAILITLSNKINKNNLKNIVLNNKILATPFINSKFSYCKEIKSVYKNFIIEPSLTNNVVFNSYTAFLNAIPKNHLLVVSSSTNFIPLVTSVVEMSVENNVYVEEDVNDLSKETVSNAEIEVVQKDANTIAIEKKSEGLIERISNETSIDLPENMQIFGSEAESGETVTESDEVEPEDENTPSFSEEQDFHTETDDTKLVTVTEEMSELVDDDTVIDSALDVVSDNVNEEDVFDEVVATESCENEAGLENNTEEEIETTEDNAVFAENEPNLELSADIEQSSPELELLDGEADSAAGLEDDSSIKSEDAELIDLEDDTINVETDSQEVEIASLIELDGFSVAKTEETDNDTIPIEEALDVTNEIVDQEIVEDVDKVFTTIKDDSISDNDLDFIDELNSGVDDYELNEVAETEFEELEATPVQDDDEAEFLEPLEEVNDSRLEEVTETDEVLQTKPSETNTLPIYDADIPQEDKVISDDISQGDLVVHAKYGNGVVEKMIKYGNKTLFSINFDNIGRRLLDPTLTEIKKG